MAAVLASGQAAVLSHTSAAELWGMLRDRRPSSPAGVDVDVHVTIPTRTLRDLRRTLPQPQFAAALRQAEFLRLPLGDSLEPDRTRSELEGRFLALCRRHRLPQPEVNVRIGGFVVDFTWPEQRLIIEVDGWGAHRTRSAFEEDRARDARLALLGYEVVRFTWRRLTRDQAAVAKTIRGLLRTKAA
jgi:very-short-patch-repair endonuclease